MRTSRIRLVLCPFALLVALTTFLLAPAVQGAPATSVGEPLLPPATGGVEAVDRALARLATHKRLLVVAAHPDDEDTSLLALVARGMGGEAAYLSLSRGEGGQNLLGPELGVGLGILRSRELLAARKIDGARQFFTRAYDFGYTRSLEETFGLWPREVLLEDIVRVIRRFRPQVVVSVFPGEPYPTHGQHQAAGISAHEAFPLAGDPEFAPQLTAQGLPPYEPQALYRVTWFDPEETTLELSTGVIDPHTGKSIFQLAMASRSQHRSQDMGTLQPLGPTVSRLGWQAGAGSAEAESLFDGIDTHLAALAETLPPGATREELARHLSNAEARARATRAALNPADPGRTVPDLVRIVDELAAARRLLVESRPADWDPVEVAAIARLIEEKRAIAEGALAAAAGLAVDATAASAELVPGQETALETTLWNAGERSAELTGVEILHPAGWSVRETERDVDSESWWMRRFGRNATLGNRGTLEPGGLARGTWSLTVSADAAPSIPYFLRHPLEKAVYDWSAAPPEVRGEPFGPPPVIARFHVRVAGVELALDREVVWRFRDQVHGEVRRPLRVVPAVEVTVEPELLVWPVSETSPRPLEVTLRRHGSETLTGQVEVRGPAGWPEPPAPRFRLDETTGSRTVRLELEPPEGFSPGHYPLEVAAVLDDGRRFELALPLVDYEHIRPTPQPVPARVEVSAMDLALPELDRVGYIRGASDRVPEMLSRVGLPIEEIAPAELLEGDLGSYDVIVVGSRAYEAEPAVARANARLLDYVRQGGLLVVQYQQYQFVREGHPPYPLDISRPHDRVTDETAPVTLLAPDHPALTTPNRIGPEDWEGWVQERGLYFAGSWDEAYTPLLAMADPGGEPLEGSLLVASLGEGTYVYSGLAFFRQLPAGVPGAYRLFANLLALSTEGDAS